MFERVSTRDPFGRVQVEHLSQEVDALWLQTWTEVLEFLASPSGEVVAPLFELSHAGPTRLIWSAECAEYLVHLVDLGVAHQEGLAAVHLSEHASDRPHIYLHALLL